MPYQHFADQLAHLKQQGNFRQFRTSQQYGRYIEIAQQQMLNLSSNDYLGIAADASLVEQFLAQLPNSMKRMSASSSRLLTGHFDIYNQLEHNLSQSFAGRAALLFNSGYHMNIGILPALADRHSLILADKLVHASMIDGIRLSSAQYLRYRHNDMQHLAELLAKYQDDARYTRIIVVTESIFSMDGDEADLVALVALKQQYSKVMLYVDEAHAVAVRGATGLGCAEQAGVIEQIDFLLGAFGKALASVGGYLICHDIIKDYLINHMRPLIFSTALAPINIAWSNFVWQHMQSLQSSRQHLAQLSDQLHQALQQAGYPCPSTSHIVPMIIGESHAALTRAKQLQQAGFYLMAVRPPTVPQHSARLRICLNSLIRQGDLELLLQALLGDSL
ncbi:8-amino-7-oxononanoate synthase [Acinetobacter larvae]|uniref:8-amino-7-oxononanoate synthase n=1 Tax=Acinetobacter larvae TaxID=1789224 RepID=A0A1B2LWX7_9GAMM|nr:8-amino-7-oxononanoate synthase [Acinetobacter larvae]AOA57437.1 8-amino-7-oxononanoate synthase [Acinetobacter larvae]